MSDWVQGYPAILPGTTVPAGCGPLPSGGTSLAVSEVACAVAMKPTLILASIGNNDALQALTFGVPPTDPAVFAAQYQQFLTGLAMSGATIVVSNVPDPTKIPYLIPVPDFVKQCGVMPVGLPGTTVTNSDFVVPDLFNIFGPVNLCGDYFVRPAALVAQMQAAVAQYNATIKALAAKTGAVVFDLNGLFQRIVQHGYDVAGQRITAEPLGGFFSLDGIHPTNTGYAIIANGIIEVMNAKLHTHIPPVNVEQIAQMDPLLPVVPSSGSTCNGTFTGTFPGDLNISSGQTCIFTAGGVAGKVTQHGGSLVLNNATVGGDVHIQGGDRFSILSSHITGNLQVQNLPAGTTQNQVCWSDIQHNLTYQNSLAPIAIGAAPGCHGNTIGGNLQINKNSASTLVSNNVINGDVQDQSNRASTQVAGNTIGGNLQVQGNTGPSTQVINNSVKKNLQCDKNSFITGGGNAALQKQGQCANL